VFVRSHQLETLGAHARGEVVVQRRRRRLVDRLTCSSVSPSVEMLRSRTGCVGGLSVMPEIMMVSDRLSDASYEHARMPPMQQRMGETFRASNR
jgi:hypothetical protein